MVVREQQAVREFERKYAALQGKLLSHPEAAQLYEDLWLRGRECGALRRDDPLEGMEVKSEVARTINALGAVALPASA